MIIINLIFNRQSNKIENNKISNYCEKNTASRLYQIWSMRKLIYKNNKNMFEKKEI